MLVFGLEKVGMQIANIYLLSIVNLLLLKKLMERLAGRETHVFALFLLLINPFSVRNILNGYSEWLTFLLAELFVLARLHELRNWVSYIPLGPLPICRQNLLFMPFLVALFDILAKGVRVPDLLVLAFAASLPLLHNLYYYSEATYLVAAKGLVLPGEFVLKYVSGLPIPELDAVLKHFPYLVQFVLSRLALYCGVPVNMYYLNDELFDGLSMPGMDA